MPESGAAPDSQPRQTPVADPTTGNPDTHDTFVSYASPDASIANDIVGTLEQSGLTCWIAPRDVQPGALYADGIIRAINGCKVLVLILSQYSVASAHVGKEVERASAKRRPIIAVRTDSAVLTPALEYFLSESQWIDIGAEGNQSAYRRLADAIRSLLANPAPPGVQQPAQFAASDLRSTVHVRREPRFSAALWAAIAIGIFIIAYLGIDKFRNSSHSQVTAQPSVPPSTNAVERSPATMHAAAPDFVPPAHSIAVLPFVNMSGDSKQDYFSDGLSEELLNSLAAVHDLKVAARTSSFSFKGKNEEVADIARKLNVGAVLEGSVRKDGNQVRITAQLINALTGYHLWSKTYDRDLKNVLKLQTEIATAVTAALQVTLLNNEAGSGDVGGTQVPAALDAYLRGKQLNRGPLTGESLLSRISNYTEALRLDPQFAKASAELANAQNTYASNFAMRGSFGEWVAKANVNAKTSLRLAPELGIAHAVMASVRDRGFQDHSGAQAEYSRALELAPNDTDVLLRAGSYYAGIGRTDAGLANIRKAIELDPLNPLAYQRLNEALIFAKQYPAALAAINHVLQINPGDTFATNCRGLTYLMLGDLENARTSCDTTPREWQGRLCMAVLLGQQQQHAAAEKELTAMQTEFGDSAAYQYAEIYAQWGNKSKALDWLETAYRVRDPGMTGILADALVDPIRTEPRFIEVVNKLQFPK